MTLDEFRAEWTDSGRDYITAHTSGSTGAPKPIHLNKEDMRLSARATIDFFGIRPYDLLAIPLAIDYIAGKMMAVRAWESGAKLHDEAPSRTPLLTLDASASVRVAAIVPQQIAGIIDAPCHIDHIIVGGAPTTAEAEMEALAGRPESAWWATYGMTETCSHVALRRFGTKEYRALPGVSFSTDDDGRLTIIRDGASWSPLATNDVVELIDSTTFLFRGRADNAIISGGLKIHPEEVEALIAPLMSGRQYYVAAKQSAEWGMEPALVIEGEADPESGTALLEEAARLTGRIKRPRSVIWMKSLPRTQSGKIIRRTF